MPSGRTTRRAAAKAVDESSLAACACFNVRNAARAITDLYDATLAPAGLRTNQFAIMAALANQPGASMQTVADLLGLDPSTMTRVLRPLEDSGWVAVGADEGRRAKQVELTAAGRRKLREGAARWQEAQDRLRDLLGDDAFMRVVTDLRMIPEALRQGGSAKRSARAVAASNMNLGRAVKNAIERQASRSRRA